MKRDELGDLLAFQTVAEERSFTRAAARLGTSQSSLSHVVRRLEEKLGVKLLNRTTRSVTPTEAGRQLLETLRPAFDDIATSLTQLNELRSRPAGTIRLTTSKSAAKSILLPVADQLMAQYPDIHIEITIDQRLVDIAKEGYDAGVRLGEQVDKDMIAVKIGPDVRMLAAASPDYFERHSIPKTPHDLTNHTCINLRFPTLGSLYVWEFEKEGRPVNVRVEGQFTCNDTDMIIDAALRGRGLAFLPNEHLAPLIQEGKLIQVLDDWCPSFPGYHLYYPSRRQMSPAFRLLIDALHYRD